MKKSICHLYGLAESRCDTMKKAGTWLRNNGIEYELHDYKKTGIDEVLLNTWIDNIGWETLLNRRGMMWRKLPQDIKDTIDQTSAIEIMLETPSIIKRPVLIFGDRIAVGFQPEKYAHIFQKDTYDIHAAKA